MNNNFMGKIMNEAEQFFQMLGDINNPEAFIQNMAKDSRVAGNPMAKNAMDLAQKHDENGLWQLANNMCASKGIDFNKSYSAFANRIKLFRHN